MGLLEANQHVGNYRVVRQIGVGGMGEAWEAANAQIGSRVALKVLLPKYSHEPDVAARFFNEARAVNMVGHPSLVKIFDFGTLPSGACYIAMEYLDGESLSNRLQSKGRLGADALRIARQTASALSVAHSKGIIHRDLKPDNLFLIKDPETAGGERVKILDFGIAKMVRQPTADETAPAQTSPDVFMGTPQYMSPEQCRGAGGVEEKSDVYSLGIILFEMLSGHLPFPAEAPVGELIAMHLYRPPPNLAELDPTITEDVSEVVAHMLAKQPTLRPSMREVAQQLEDLGAPKATGPVQLLSWGPENRVGALPSAVSTLGNTAGQRNSQQGKRQTRAPAAKPKLSLSIIGALGVAVIGGGGLLAKHYWPVTPRPTSVPTSAPTTRQAEPPPPAQEPSKPAPPPPPERPAQPAAPKLVRLHVESSPPGAEIVDVDRDEVVGTTPWDGERTAQSGSVHLQLLHKGYQDEAILVQGDRDSSIKVVLHRLERSHKPVGRKDAITDDDGNHILLPSQLPSSSSRKEATRAD